MRQRRRFSPEFKAQVVLDVLTGQASPAEVCREHGLSPNLLSLWKATFLQRAHTAFQTDERRSDEAARIAELERLVGRLTMEREVLPLNASIARPPFSPDSSPGKALMRAQTRSRGVRGPGPLGANPATSSGFGYEATFATFGLGPFRGGGAWTASANSVAPAEARARRSPGDHSCGPSATGSPARA
jgi:transposase